MDTPADSRAPLRGALPKGGDPTEGGSPYRRGVRAPGVRTGGARAPWGAGLTGIEPVPIGRQPIAITN